MLEADSKWRIAVHREAQRELRRLPRHILQSALESLHALADNPYPTGCGKLRGYESLYRIRVGDWRIVYAVDSATRSIIVLRVASGGEVYRDFLIFSRTDAGPWP